MKSNSGKTILKDFFFRISRFFTGNVSGGKNIQPYVIVLFFIIYTFGNYVYRLYFDEPAIYDDKWHLEYAYDAFKNLQSGGLKALLFRPVTFYAPLVYYVAILFFMVFGVSIKTALLSQSVFVLILFLSVYYLVEHFQDTRCGLLAAVITACMPMTMFLAGRLYLDMALMAMTSLSVLFLVKSERFQNQKFTVLFFISMALGGLTKISFFFYMTVPTLVVAVLYLKGILREDRRNFCKRLLFLIAPFLLFGMGVMAGSVILGKSIINPAYDRAIVTVLSPDPEKYQSNRQFEDRAFVFFITVLVIMALFALIQGKISKFQKDKPLLTGLTIFSMANISYYMVFISPVIIHSGILGTGGKNTENFAHFTRFLVLESWGCFSAFMILTGTVYYIVSKEKSGDLNIVFLGMVSSLVILYLLPIKDPRYFLPVICFASPFATIWIFRIRGLWIKGMICLLIACYCLAGWVSWVFVDPRIPAGNLDIATRVAAGIDNRRMFPPHKGDIMPKSIASILDIVMKNESCIMIAQSGKNAGDSSILFALPTYLRYGHNRELYINHFISRLFETSHDGPRIKANPIDETVFVNSSLPCSTAIHDGREILAVHTVIDAPGENQSALQERITNVFNDVNLAVERTIVINVCRQPRKKYLIISKLVKGKE